MKFSRKRKQFFIFFVDLLILCFSFYIALLVRNFELPGWSFFFHLLSILPVFAMWVILMYTFNFYCIDKPFWEIKFPIKLFIIALFSMFFGFGVYYFIDSNGFAPKTILVLHTTISYFLIMLWRFIYDFFLQKNINLYQYICMGYNKTFDELIEISKSRSYVNFKPVAIFDENLEYNFLPDSKIPVLRTVEELSDFLKNSHVKIFVMPLEKEFPKEVMRILFTALEDKCYFYSLSDFFEIITRKVPLGAINESWFLSNISLENRSFLNFSKRFFDILFSATLLLLTLPFWPFIALIIKLESEGPVFFKQVRCGKNGKNFTVYKFRTMKTKGNDFAPTSKQDSRVTKFGNFMRKTRIDEIPQVLNVFQGSMTLIGPRPERPELVVELEKAIPYYRQRLMVKPGITGWDQVSGEYHSPSVEDTYKKLQLDLYYIKNQSIHLDISIFFKTIMTVILKQGR